MIRYIKRKNLDVEKYNVCIQKSLQSRVYAYSWYLDIVADNWDVLVLEDYDVVMPVPWKKKYFIKYVYQPLFTQQLGVFSSEKIEEVLLNELLESIPKRFLKIQFQFNSEIELNEKNSTERNNYILSLDKEYRELYSGFNLNRKRNLKKTNQQKFDFNKEVLASDFLAFIKKTPRNYRLDTNQVLILHQISMLDKNKVSIWGIEEKGVLQSAVLWLFDTRRITYLFPIANNEAKKKGYPSLLIIELIKQYANTNFTLDFEGSMIQSIADFYKSFGAEKEIYSWFKKGLF